MKDSKLLLVVQVAVVQRDDTFSQNEKFWTQEQVVVPFERYEALDANAMIRDAVRKVVVIAGITDEKT